MTPEQEEALRKRAVAELWRRRAFWPLLEHYLDMDQLADLQAFFAGVRPEAGELPRGDENKPRSWYDEISRQRGKSYKWTVLSVVWCHCHPGQRVKYLAQLGTSVRGIIAPTIDALIDDMPPQMRPTWKPQKGVIEWIDPDLGQIRIDRQDHKWHFPHPGGRESVIHAAGANNQHYRALRGEPAHFQIQDECGFYDDFEGVEQVLGPMLLTTNGVTVYSTTPPIDPEVPLRKVRDAHRTAGRYIHRTIYNHPRLTKEQIEDFIRSEALKKGQTVEEFKRSTYFQRELLGLWVADDTRAVVPEWNQLLDYDKPESGTHGDTLLYEHDTLPEFFAPLEALDIGFTLDPSGYLFGYWDSREAVLCILDERPPLYRKRTDEQAAEFISVRKKWLPPTRRAPYPEAKLYEHDPEHPENGHWLPYLSVGDAGGFGAEKLAELRKEHGVDFLHAKKTDLESMADALRRLVRAGKVRIHKRCTTLRNQIAGGLWADKQKTDLERTKTHHNDHLAALIYLVAMLDAVRNFDPYPLNWGVDLANTITPERTRDGASASVIRNVFG